MKAAHANPLRSAPCDGRLCTQMQHCFGIYLIKNQLAAQGWLEMQIRLM